MQWGRGGVFHSSAKFRLKSIKNVVFSIFCMPMGGGGCSPPPGYGTGHDSDYRAIERWIKECLSLGCRFLHASRPFLKFDPTDPSNGVSRIKFALKPGASLGGPLGHRGAESRTWARVQLKYDGFPVL